MGIAKNILQSKLDDLISQRVKLRRILRRKDNGLHDKIKQMLNNTTIDIKDLRNTIKLLSKIKNEKVKRRIS